MVNSRAALAVLLLAACLPAYSSAGHTAFPSYQIGDIVREDILARAPLSTAGSATSDAVPVNSPDEIPLVVRFNPKGPDEAEISLRAAFIMARYNFLRCFQEQLLGRKPTEADIGSPAYARAVAEVARSSPPHFPFDQLSPLWVRGQSEETFVLTLAQPIRQAMANLILDTKSGPALPPNQSLRLVTVKNLNMPLGKGDLDGPGLIVSQSKTIGLSYARQLVENNFPATQPALARFASAFVRPNAQTDSAATSFLQTRFRQQALAGYSPLADQVIVRKGQIVDRQTLDTLAAFQETQTRSSIETPLAPAPPPLSATVYVPAIHITERDPLRWFLVSGVGVVAALAGLLRLRRARKRTTRARLVVRESPRTAITVLDDSIGPNWQERAHLAEAKAERAHEAIRSGVLERMKDKIVGTLSRHRTELLAAQHKARIEMEQLERRLEQLHAPLQQRIQAYEKRIAELEAKLANKGEENRHLLGARILLARQQLERSRFEAN